MVDKDQTVQTGHALFEAFVEQVKQLLEHLYDFAYLQQHPLSRVYDKAGDLSAKTAGRQLRYELITAIPGVSCVKPSAALYMFPRLDPAIYPIKDDRQFFLELLKETKVMLVQGTGFNWPDPDHFRIVFLPHEEDLREAIGHGMTVRPIPNMVNHETNELFFENLEIPAENLIGEEGQGFRYILDGLNAERTLIAAECIGDGYWFIDRVTKYVKERVVFGRPIGQNQGIQHPLAECWALLESAYWMVLRAGWLYDAGKSCAAEANAAKLLAGRAAFQTATRAVMTHGGMGYAQEYQVERLFRESILTRIAPITEELVLSFLAERVLGLPKSY